MNKTSGSALRHAATTIAPINHRQYGRRSTHQLPGPKIRCRNAFCTLHVHLDRSRTQLSANSSPLTEPAIRGTVHLPPLFWWEGLDGSRVLTMYSTIYGNVYGNVVLGNRWVD